jgi:hypothetical protein
MTFKHLQLLLMLILGMTLLCISTHAMEPKLATPLTGEYNNFLPTGEITRFAGKTLYYDISFLWFENVASKKRVFLKSMASIFQFWEPAPKGL